MEIYNVILRIFNKIKRDKIFVYASHASFYILISAIPFITLFISLTEQFLSLPEYEISKVILSFFPEVSLSAARKILEEVFYKSSGELLSFSAISLFWTASRGVSALRRGLRFIYGYDTLPFITDVLSSIWLMFFMILLVFFMLILAVFSVTITSGILMFFIGFSVLTGIFSLVYFLFSGRKMPFKSNLPGGVSASFSWILFIRIFSFYIEHFSNYSYIYGSLTTIFILVLWLYFSTIIFFLGAELNIIIYSGLLKNKD